MADFLDHPSLPSEPSPHKTHSSFSEAPTKSADSGAWGRLAARIVQWTTRGLLCAIVLVACVGFGRQILQWWQETPPGISKTFGLADPLAGLGEEERLHVFRFKDLPWECWRQMIRGDAKKAVELLKSLCAQATSNCQTNPPLPAPQEHQFLEKLQHQIPVAQGRGWKVYTFHESVPLVVGILESCPSGDFLEDSPLHKKALQKKGKEEMGSSGEISPLDAPPLGSSSMPSQKGESIKKSPTESFGSKPDVAPSSRTVVCWGFGIPAGEERWTLYVLVACGPGYSIPLKGGLSIPIPPETHLLYCLGVVEGPTLIWFQGPPRPETWKIFYETFFRTHGGQQIGPWQQEASRWRGRFLWPATQPPQQPLPQAQKIVEISFGPETTDTWNGLIWIWIGPPSQ